MENVKINRRCIAFPKPIHQYGEISIAKFCTKGCNGLNNQQRNQNGSCRPPQLTAHKQKKKQDQHARANEAKPSGGASEGEQQLIRATA